MAHRDEKRCDQEQQEDTAADDANGPHFSVHGDAPRDVKESLEALEDADTRHRICRGNASHMFMRINTV